MYYSIIFLSLPFYDIRYKSISLLLYPFRIDKICYQYPYLSNIHFAFPFDIIHISNLASIFVWKKYENVGSRLSDPHMYP
jgi:hypothetical protein